MKTLFILICLLTASFTSMAQFKPKAAFDYYTGGYITKTSQPIVTKIGTREVETIMNYGSFRVRIGGEYQYNKFSVYFDQHIYMQKYTGFTFQPLQAEWFAGITYNVTENIKLRAEHLCAHPVVTDGISDTQTKVYGGYNMLSISYGY